MANWLSELCMWLASLDATFAFLLALPFLVALAGLIALFFEKEPGQTQSAQRSMVFTPPSKKPTD